MGLNTGLAPSWLEDVVCYCGGLMLNTHPAILPLRGEQLKAFPRLPCSQESGCDKSRPSHPVQSEKAESRGESEDIFVLLLVFLLVVVAWFRSCQETFQCYWRLLDFKRGRNPLVFCFHGFGIVPQNSASSFFLQPSE